MRKIYIASHGKYSEGIVHALRLLVGENDVQAICAYCDDINDSEDLVKQFDNITRDAGEASEIVIFTDLMGGSITNEAMKYLVKHENVYLMTGVNLPMILEFALSGDDSIEDAVKKAINAGKEGITFVNKLIESSKR